jgi:hypothetical protein
MPVPDDEHRGQSRENNTRGTRGPQNQQEAGEPKSEVKNLYRVSDDR